MVGQPAELDDDRPAAAVVLRPPAGWTTTVKAANVSVAAIRIQYTARRLDDGESRQRVAVS